METIKEQNITGKTVTMDNARFIRCTLTNCDLVFGGGDTEWQETNFTNCRLGFTGAAQKTAQYLQCFGLLSSLDNPLAPPIPTGGTMGKIKWHRPN